MERRPPGTLRFLPLAIVLALGCASVTDVIGLDQLHMSRLNEPPAVKAKVCVTSRPKVGIDRPQTACATAFAFVDRSQGI